MQNFYFCVFEVKGQDGQTAAILKTFLQLYLSPLIIYFFFFINYYHVLLEQTSRSSLENKSSHNSREPVGHKASSSSSRTKTSTTTRSTELNSRTSSGEDFEVSQSVFLLKKVFN